MTFPRTKIRPPQPRAAYVERGTLQARLAEALSARRVVLVVAPAGYGKTMLLAQAIARMPADRAVAWISVDAGDDLQGLVECLLAALEPFDPPWRTAPEALLAQLGQREADDRRSVTAEIINTLDACEVPHGVIVLDDLHRVDDPAFFRFLDQMIERMTPRWTLVLASRVEPPLALARLRASDEMAEFTQLQLQFARDDARRMAAAAGLDQALADRVFDRTQGWPAGLRIAIGAMRQDAATPSPAAPSAIERALRAGNRPLFEFLLAAGDIGPCAFGIFGRGDDLVGKSICIAGEHLTGAQMAAALARALGEPVVHEAMSPDEYRELGFPGADDLGNMFAFKREFEQAYCASRPVACARALNPALLDFTAWLDRYKAYIPVRGRRPDAA